MNISPFVSTFYKWVLGIPQKPREKKNAAEKFMLGIRVTAQCRFNAANTLRFKNFIAFQTTTLVSLGLILIPLVQSTGIDTHFDPKVLNSIQIFFAVVILVYSVVINQARYSVRADNFTKCGDNLKELSREVGRFLETALNHDENYNTQLQEYDKKYNEIMRSSENHHNNDYLKSSLRMKHDFNITGITYLYGWARWFIVEYIYILVPLLILSAELFFITDMLGSTKMFPDILRK